jgi:hypothetical protein
MVENNGFIPNHQFGFRERHSITEHTHRTVQWKNEALAIKQYYSASFLDISQAFDTVWHAGSAFLSELFHFTQILFAQQTLSREI